MTWHTQLGERVLAGAEAELIRHALGFVTDSMVDELEFDGEQWKYGIEVFDNLIVTSRLALLAEVGWALFRETDSCPKLTAINEGTIATLLVAIRDGIQSEAESQKFDRSFFWRDCVLTVFAEDAVSLELPARESTDGDDWEELIGILDERLLWDSDFEDAGAIQDAPPEHAAAMRSLFSIDPDYYQAIAPDPTDEELPRIQAVLNELCKETASGTG